MHFLFETFLWLILVEFASDRFIPTQHERKDQTNAYCAPFAQTAESL